MTDQWLLEDQRRDRHIRDMGRPLGEVYHALCNEVTWLHAKWNQYRTLWGHSPERVEFLNRIASHFFLVVQDGLYDDVLAHLSRLIDQLGDGAKKRLTLRRLPPLVLDPVLRREVEERFQDAEDACASARASRNQRIGHTNLRHALNSTFDPLPSRAEIERALGAIRAVLHCLEMHYWQSSTAYQEFHPLGGTADELLFWLETAVRAEEEKMERWRQGKPRKEDL